MDHPEYEDQYHQLHLYFESKILHMYSVLSSSGIMPSARNSKSLQRVVSTDEGRVQLGVSNYYKYRAETLMFGFNANILSELKCFCKCHHSQIANHGCVRMFCVTSAEFNALRKNQLLQYYHQLQPILTACNSSFTKYRDYYYQPIFEIGQQELVDLHRYTYLADMHALISKQHGANSESAHDNVEALAACVRAVNELLTGKFDLDAHVLGISIGACVSVIYTETDLYLVGCWYWLGILTELSVSLGLTLMLLVGHTYFSTSRESDYQIMLTKEKFAANSEVYRYMQLCWLLLAPDMIEFCCPMYTCGYVC